MGCLGEDQNTQQREGELSENMLCNDN